MLQSTDSFVKIPEEAEDDDSFYVYKYFWSVTRLTQVMSGVAHDRG